jgi:choline kinase
MQAVILAAGVGSRLGETAGTCPKCLIDVGGKTIVERQITCLRAGGVKEIVVVTGYEELQVRTFVGDRFDNIVFVNNPRYAETNTIYSLYLGAPYLTEDFFYCNGDVVFGEPIVSRCDAAGGTALAVEFKQCGDEEVKVRLDGTRVMNISKQVAPGEAAGEFIGVALFRSPMHEQFFASLADNVEQKNNIKDYFEKALDDIAATVPLHAVDITGEPVVEIDFPEDLKTARQIAHRL